MSHKVNMGRKAIDWLKETYEDGTEFADTKAIAEALASNLGMRRKIALRNATDWDRQARYELHARYLFVTNPAPQQRYERTPNASPAKREATLGHLHSHNVTRIANTALQAESAANQIDASRDEIEINLLYSQIQHLTAQVNDRIAETRSRGD